MAQWVKELVPNLLTCVQYSSSGSGIRELISASPLTSMHVPWCMHTQRISISHGEWGKLHRVLSYMQSYQWSAAEREISFLLREAPRSVVQSQVVSPGHKYMCALMNVLSRVCVRERHTHNSNCKKRRS